MKSRTALFFLGSSLLLAALVPIPARADNTIDQLKYLANSDDQLERRSICAQILSEKPKKYAYHFCQGYEAIFLGLDSEAERHMEKVLHNQPDFALATILFGEGFESLGKYREAEKYYQWAIDVQPGRTDSRFALGRLYLKQAEAGRESYYPLALEAFRQMAEAKSSSHEGFTNMGHVLTQMERYEDAESVYKKALAKEPGRPELYNNLAALYARQDRNEEAEQWWRQALALSPGYGAATIELASLFGREGDLVKALVTLQSGKEATMAPPWGPKIRRNLGFAYLGMDQVDRGRNQFIDAVTSGSGDALAHLGLAHVRMLEGNTTVALPEFRIGTELDSTHAEPFLLAWKSTLGFALPEDETGALATVLQRFDNPAEREAAEATLGGSRTEKATAKLAAFVLEDWKFVDADLAVQEFDLLGGRVDELGYDQAPIPIEQVPANYPDSAQEQGLAGEVLVKVTVDPTGKVIDALVESTNADPSLTDSAIEAAMKWTFEPATRYGSPVQATIVIPFRFIRRG